MKSCAQEKAGLFQGNFLVLVTRLASLPKIVTNIFIQPDDSLPKMRAMQERWWALTRMQVSEIVTQTPACEQWSFLCHHLHRLCPGEKPSPCVVPGYPDHAWLLSWQPQPTSMDRSTESLMRSGRGPRELRLPGVLHLEIALGELKIQGAVPRQMGIYSACQVWGIPISHS